MFLSVFYLSILIVKDHQTEPNAKYTFTANRFYVTDNTKTEPEPNRTEHGQNSNRTERNPNFDPDRTEPKPNFFC